MGAMIPEHCSPLPQCVQVQVMTMNLKYILPVQEHMWGVCVCVCVCVCVFLHHSKCGEAGGEQAFEAWDQIPLLALASYEILSKLF